VKAKSGGKGVGCCGGETAGEEIGGGVYKSGEEGGCKEKEGGCCVVGLCGAWLGVGVGASSGS